MNKVKIVSKKTGKEQTVSKETLQSLQDLNGKHAFKVVQENTTPAEIAEPKAAKKTETK